MGIIIPMNEYGIVVLAAGASKRLGFPKQLLEVNNESFLRSTLSMASRVTQPVVCVLGYNYNRFEKETKGLDVEVVFNLNWNKGVATSIKEGFNYIHKHYPYLKGVLFLNCDQPYVDSELIRKIMNAHGEANSIVSSINNQIIYMPILIGKNHFKDIFKLKDDENLFTLTSAFGSHGVQFDNAAVNINTEQDWLNFFNQIRQNRAS
ncbi:nucleotidyltransferase family protein [Fulvivirga lutea]|uniref:Nucleotidyltransferase family protein n=1 Tax=Fulvivirga lutea TaxID=2810512 RepID=A0A974WJ57_9BACT|nr:nucleotidyltransferase family protein [Fulvivirga lutea]QSE98899.1 nucleotidyltransferase family protein [Fulvivirga lutea]